MPSYAYTARAPDATTPKSSTLEAPSKRLALQALRARGLQVVQLDEVVGGGQKNRDKPAATFQLSRRLRLPFLEALARMVQAGMSAGESIRTLATKLQEPRLRALCGALWSRLGEGATLSQAMAAHPVVFDHQTVSLVAAGEATGNLREITVRLVAHFREQRDLQRQFLASLAYPAFICVLGCCVALFLVFFMVPRLQSLLGSLGGQLPWVTQVLISASRFLLFYGPLLLVVAVAGASLFWRWRNSENGRRTTDGWALKLPVIRDFTKRAAMLDFCHTMAVLLENGVTSSEALRLTERAARNIVVQELLREATDRIIEGASMSAALTRTGIFDPLVADQLAIGEQTGDLVPGLRQAAKTTQEDLSVRLNQATRIVSGTVLLATFGFVAFLAYAIVSALLQVSTSVRL